MTPLRRPWPVSSRGPIFPAEGRSPEALTDELVAVLERYVAAYPEQWLMVHDFWG